jgi:hypothetical protein
MQHTARNRTLWLSAEDAARRLDLCLTQAAVGGASDGNITSQL